MVQRYTRTAMLFHWLIAVGIVVNVGLAWIWWYLPDAAVRPAIDTHKSIGVTILGLAVMRLIWRWTHRPPPFPADYTPVERKAAHGVHWAFYALIFAMPLTGWIMDSAYKDAASHPMYWFGLFQWPRIAAVMNIDPVLRERIHDGFGAAHGYLAWVVYALFALHVGAVAKHEWIDGDRELKRMLPGRADPAE